MLIRRCGSIVAKN